MRASCRVAFPLVLAAALGACRAAEPVRIQLSESTTAPESAFPGSSRPVALRLAVAAMLSPRATIESYDPLRRYLAGLLGGDIELVQRATYAEVNDLVRTGEVDIAFVCTGAFVEGYHRFGMELLAAPAVRGQDAYFSLVIVPAASRAQRFEDLRAQSFAFTDPLSNSGYLAPLWLLHDMGETPEHFFGAISFTRSHDHSIQAVADGVVDGAAVDSLVYDSAVARDRSLATRTRVVHRSGPFGMPPVVVRPGLDRSVKAHLRAAFLEMHRDPAGAAALQALEIDRFVVADLRAYASVQRMAATLRRWHAAE